MATIEEYLAKKAELEAYVSDEGKNILRDFFLNFFKQNPEIPAVRWTQYTPYFNDGEPCVFGVQEPSYKLSLGLPDEDHDEFKDSWQFRKQSPNLYKRLGKFEADFSSLESLFENVFGDSVKVTASLGKDGVVSFEVDEYEHD